MLRFVSSRPAVHGALDLPVPRSGGAPRRVTPPGAAGAVGIAAGLLLVVVVVAAPAAGAAAQEQAAAPPPVTPANGRSIELEGQLQVQAASSPVDTAVTWDAELRRVRLTAIGDAGSGFSGTLQTDFGSDRVRIRDAFVEFQVTPQVALRAGQFKIPFNGIELVSSKRLLVIERGNRIRGLAAGQTSTFLEDNRLSARNRGVMVTAKLAGGRLALQAGGWQGAGERADDNDGKELAARVELALVEAEGPDDRSLVLGVAAVTNGYFGSPRDTLKTAGGDSLVVDDARYAGALEGWLEYGQYLVAGLHVAGNVIAGENPQIFTIQNGNLEFERFLGLQGWGEFLVATETGLLTGWAPAFRADRFDPDTDAAADARLLLTPGLNLYFGRSVKAQLNLELNVPEDEALDTQTALRVQTQVLF